MPLRAILFDHDGTLVDSEPVHFRLWAAVLERYGVSLSESQYKTHCIGTPTRENASRLARHFSIKEAAAKLSEEKISATREYLARSSLPLMDGVREAISEFHGIGLTLAIVTSANAYVVRETLRSNDLERQFSLVVSREDVRLSKPAPDCYLLALKKLGLSYADCIAIEDSSHGVEAAYYAGLRCLALPTKMTRHQDFRHATEVLGAMSEAIEYIKQLSKE